MDEERTVADRLAELQQLHDDGLITDDEFAERRTAILDELSAAPSPPPPTVSPTTSKSGTPGRWTPQEQALYRTANPKKGMSTTAKVALGIAIVVGIVVIFSYLADDANLGSQTFPNVADSLDGSSGQTAFNKTLTGTGVNSTESFRLNGDFTVTLKTTGDCLYYFDLERTSDSRTQEDLGSHDGADSTSTRIYAVPSGLYFVDVNTGPSPSCPWSVTIKG